jgi:hypothetical protein
LHRVVVDKQDGPGHWFLAVRKELLTGGYTSGPAQF